MAKKTLLSEGNIRKFMKLAAIEPLTENFLAEVEEEEETMAEADGPMDEADEPMGDEPMDDKEETDGDMDDMGDGGDMDDMGAGGTVPVEEFMQALKRALEEVTGEDVEVTGDTGAEPAGDDESLEEGYMSEEDTMDEDLYEELNESVKVVDTQAIVKEVSRRVAQRLIKESKQEQLAEALARKIAARLR